MSPVQEIPQGAIVAGKEEAGTSAFPRAQSSSPS
jgi:hypothetical protein